jgi:putative oxidoreductase
MDSGLLVVRLVAGVLMASHGAQKLFGWFGGYGVAGTGGFMESLGFRPGRTFAAAAGLSEFAGGTLVALGLLGPVGPALILSVMIVAALSVHVQNGLYAASNGVELPLLYGAVAVGLALTGPGAWSLDALVGGASGWSPSLTLIVLGIASVGAFANLAVRGRTPVTA